LHNSHYSLRAHCIGGDTYYIIDWLESNSAEHYSCSTPSPHHPLCLDYTSQFALDGHPSDIPLDALDGHGSLMGDLEEDTQADPYNLFTLDPYDSLVPDYWFPLITDPLLTLS
jgi:hypothetical protein